MGEPSDKKIILVSIISMVLLYLPSLTHWYSENENCRGKRVRQVPDLFFLKPFRYGMGAGAVRNSTVDAFFIYNGPVSNKIHTFRFFYYKSCTLVPSTSLIYTRVHLLYYSKESKLSCLLCLIEDDSYRNEFNRKCHWLHGRRTKQ
jgi:hypothetical protein